MIGYILKVNRILVNEYIYKKLLFITIKSLLIGIELYSLRVNSGDEWSCFSILDVGQIAWMKQICGNEENRNSFLVNNCPDMFPFEGLGNIPLLQTIDDLNLADHLKGFKRRQV
jgi:hypothetical protein